MRKQLLLVLLSVGGMISPARAQFIGYTSPQTLATSIACTGSTQTYPINNLGQTQHYLSIANISTGTTQLQAAIQGVDVQGNVFQISDVLELGGSNLGSRQGNLTASGYFPKIQVAITCSPNTGTYSASYSGAWGTFNVNAGAYLTAQIDKVSFSGADATVNQTNIFQTPFGSS